MITLKPCPFCGGMPEILSLPEKGPYRGLYNVIHRCKHIGFLNILDWTDKVTEERLADWNHRMPENSHDPALVEWLANGERGSSSEAIVTFLTGLEARPHWGRDCYSYPRDVSDLVRCFALLEAVPRLAKHFHLMAEASPEWKALVGKWDALKESFEKEHPNWREGNWAWAPKTGKLFRSVLGVDDEAGKGG